MKKQRSVGVDPVDRQNRISEGTKIVGDITSEGGFRIDGEVEGKIVTPGKVVLGKSGSIKGNLDCSDADIEGTFNGNLSISGILSLKSTAHIEGEVVTNKLSVEPGATFNASCEMKGTQKQTTSNVKKETEKPA